MKLFHLAALAGVILALGSVSAEAQSPGNFTTITGQRLKLNAPPDAQNSGPIFVQQDESYNVGQDAFAGGNVFVSNRTNGGGNREVIHAEYNNNGANAGDQLVGITGIGRVTAGSGTAYGMNPVCEVFAGAAQTAQCIGMEINTNARRDVNAKVGFQVVDTAVSTGQGILIDTGMIMAKQTGGAGWKRGIQIGYSDAAGTTDFENQYPVKAGGSLFYSIPTGRVLATGIDFSKITQPFSDAAIKLAVGNQIKWGDTGNGGTFTSAAGSAGPRFIFGDNLAVIRKSDNSQDFLQVSADGVRSLDGFISPLRSPASNSACTVGKAVDDANYHYVCVATNQWKRVALSAY